MTTIALPAMKFNRTTFVSAGLIWSFSILIIDTLPLVFQALGQGRGLSEDQLGVLGTAFVLGSGITSATGPFWVYRASPKWVSCISLLVAAVGLLGIAFSSAGTNLAYWWFLVGLANGCFATPSFTVLGYTENPLRAYSLALFTAIVIAALASYTLPLIVVQFGDSGMMLAIAALFVLAVPLALMLSDVRQGAAKVPAAQVDTSNSFARSSGYRLMFVAPVLAAAAGGAFMGIFMGGVYNFVGTLAAADGISAQAVGPIVAATLICSLAGSLLPSILGERIHATIMIGLSAAVVVFTYPFMMGHSAKVFGIAFVVHGVFGTLGYTYYLGAVRRIDVTNRIYVAYPAVQLLGIAAGTAFSGLLLARFTTMTFFGVSATLIVASWIVLLVAERISIHFRSHFPIEDARTVLQR